MTTSLLSAGSSTPLPEINPKFFGRVAQDALETLQQRTAARVGHRTVMDSLIPFTNTLAETGDLKLAVEEAEKGAKATATMQAKLGRATYVGEIEGKEMPPDPGAMAFACVVRGILRAVDQ
jgi:dihydroxyacetone kinase